MREINIEVFDDKTIKVSNSGNLGDKFDNEIYQLRLNFDNCKFFSEMDYKYFLIKWNTEEEIIRIYEENQVIVLTKEFTSKYGSWDCLIVLSDQELDGHLENNKDVWISNVFKLNITNNFIEDTNNIILKNNKEAL